MLGCISMAEEDLPDCNCGENDWEEIYERTNQVGRRERVFKCRECGDEGKIFDKGEGSTIYSGAMRQ